MRVQAVLSNLGTASLGKETMEIVVHILLYNNFFSWEIALLVALLLSVYNIVTGMRQRDTLLCSSLLWNYKSVWQQR